LKESHSIGFEVSEKLLKPFVIPLKNTKEEQRDFRLKIKKMREKKMRKKVKRRIIFLGRENRKTLPNLQQRRRHIL